MCKYSLSVTSFHDPTSAYPMLLPTLGMDMSPSFTVGENVNPVLEGWAIL